MNFILRLRLLFYFVVFKGVYNFLCARHQLFVAVSLMDDWFSYWNRLILFFQFPIRDQTCFLTSFIILINLPKLIELLKNLKNIVSLDNPIPIPIPKPHAHNSPSSLTYSSQFIKHIRIKKSRQLIGYFNLKEIQYKIY